MQPFDDFIEVPKQTAVIPAPVVVESAIDWLEQHKTSDFFLYIHLMDTHAPRLLGTHALRLAGRGAQEMATLTRPSREHRENNRPFTAEERFSIDAQYDVVG